MNLYIYSYNNYYNRQVKKAGDTLEDYAQYKHYGPVTGVYGFTPGDGVNTTQIIGTNAQTYDGKGNYLIVQDQQTGEINSRWFIIDVNRTRNGQWELTLHRDLIVDYYDVIVDSPMYVEKATLSERDPFIFNSEQLSLNQIKSGEYQIKDKSDCAWIVGYLSRNNEDYGPYNIDISSTLYNEQMTQSEWTTLVNKANGYTINNGYEFKFESKWSVVSTNFASAGAYTYHLNSDNIGKWTQSSQEF